MASISAAPSPLRCAAAVVDTALLVTRLVRSEVRRNRPARLSVSQIRALGFLAAHPDVSLAEAADYLGVAPPSASKLIDGLVRRSLVTRRTASDDRRRLVLRLTIRGRTRLAAAFTASRAVLAHRFEPLTPAERVQITAAMERLRSLLAPSATAPRTRARVRDER